MHLDGHDAPDAPDGPGRAGRSGRRLPLAGYHDAVIGLVGVGGHYVAWVGPPFGWPGKAGLDYLQARDEPAHVVATADVGLLGGVIEDPLDVADLGDGVGCRMRYRDLGAGREWVGEPGDEPGRVILVGDEMQDGQEEKGRGLAEIYQSLHGRVGEDLVRLEQVLLDDRGVRDALEHGPGVGEDHRIVIDVDHPGRRVGVQGDLVGVAHGRQPGPDVDDLPYARLIDQVADHPAEEGPVPLDGELYVRQLGDHRFGHRP